MRPHHLAVLVLGGLGGLAVPAAAHIQLGYPTQRIPDQKAGPCGAAASTRGAATTFAPGETITVRWDETINHGGHFRISFDVDGQGFSNPATGDEDFAETLLDDIADRVVDGDDGPGDDSYAAQITFPPVECTSCTLQLIQVMKVAPPYAEDDLYFQCADITLSGAPAPDAGPDVGGSDAGGGGGGDGDGDGSGDGSGDGDHDGHGAGSRDAVGGCAASGAGDVGLAALLALAAALLTAPGRPRRRTPCPRRS